jgi:hypothetical protein
MRVRRSFIEIVLEVGHTILAAEVYGSQGMSATPSGPQSARAG